MMERRRLEIPAWANGEARRYLSDRRFPVGESAVQFGRQVVWLRVSTRQGPQEVPPFLGAAEMFEYYPADRGFYTPYFPFRRSTGALAPVRNALTRDDELWEALYQTYQLWNSDMRRLVFSQHQQPSAARGFLYQLDQEIHRQLIGAMLDLSTSYIPGTGSAHQQLPELVRQTAQWIAQRFRNNASLAGAIMATSQRAQAAH
jgi:hypothetical protein